LTNGFIAHIQMKSLLLMVSPGAAAIAQRVVSRYVWYWLDGYSSLAVKVWTTEHRLVVGLQVVLQSKPHATAAPASNQLQVAHHFRCYTVVIRVCCRH
jgi:hypothetical protein